VTEVSTHKSPLLTPQEAAEWLRLTGPDGPKNPEYTLRYYREKGLLRCVQIGRRARYHVRDLEDLVEQLRGRGRA